MRRTLCPGELRFLSMGAGPGASPVWTAGPFAGAVAGTFGTVQLGLPLGIAIGAIVGGFATAFAHVRRPPIERNAKIIKTALDVCPWGVVGQRGAYGWPAFRDVQHISRQVQQQREAVIVNLLYLEISEKTFFQCQSREGDPSLVQVLHPRFAQAAARNVAVGLEDAVGLPGDTQDLATQIIEAARRIVLAAEPSSWFERRETREYRGAARVALTEAAAEALQRGLLDEPSGRVDFAPLHAALLAECGVAAAGKELLELTMSPNVVVAAAARAAAMRLGVSPVRTGPLHELGAFLPAGEIASWDGWAKETAQPGENNASDDPA